MPSCRRCDTYIGYIQEEDYKKLCPRCYTYKYKKITPPQEPIVFDKSKYTEYEWLKLEMELKNKVNRLLAEKEVLLRNVTGYMRLTSASTLALMGSLAFIIFLGPAIWLSATLLLLTTASTLGNAFCAANYGTVLGTRKYSDSVQEKLDLAQNNLEMFYIANDWPIPFRGSPEAVDAVKFKALQDEAHQLRERIRIQHRKIEDLSGPKQIEGKPETIEVTDGFGNPVDTIYKNRLTRTQMRNGGFI